MNNKISAHDITAFAVVELNVPLPIELFYDMSMTDPLYQSLMKAWKDKQKRLDGRNALLCAVIANCMGSGNKKFEISDFMPKEPKTTEQMEAELKAALTMHNEYWKNNQIRR